jgi:hypothetical protein
MSHGISLISVDLLVYRQSRLLLITISWIFVSYGRTMLTRWRNIAELLRRWREIVHGWMRTAGRMAASRGTGTQWKSQPLVAQLNSDWLKWLALAKFLGLTPASDKVKNQTGENDKFDDF